MSETPSAYQPPPPKADAVAFDVGPSGQASPDTKRTSESWLRTITRVAQFARHPRLSLPKPAGGLPGSIALVLRMVSIDLVLRLGTIPLVLFGTWLLGGAEYTALDTPDGTELNKLYIFIAAAVAAPLLEETAMRLQIHRWSEWRFWLSTAVWSLFVGVTAWETTGIQWLPAAFPIGLILWRLFALVRKNAAESWNMHPRIVLWGVTLGFGLMHLTNYDIPTNSWRLIAVFLLVLPQIIGGLLMAYTRVRVGFWGGVAHHAISNALLVALVLPSL